MKLTDSTHKRSPAPETGRPDVEELSRFLQVGRALIQQKVLASAPGLPIAAEIADLVDEAIRRMLTIACERVGKGLSPANIPIAVVATGGYGRRELCPYSDIDLTFIPHHDTDETVDQVIKQMFTLVMDVFIARCSIQVGYAYRLMDDCADLDHQTRSGLLDARLVAGSERVFIGFENEYWNVFNPADFIFHKLEERRQAQTRWGLTPRVVEPNLKEGVGGLRELQTAVWICQARYLLPAARVRGERAWEALVRNGALTEAEGKELAASKEFLFRARNALHAITQAERDELVVTRQEEVAHALGYTDLDESGATPPVERFLRELYVHLARTSAIARRVYRVIEDEPLFLGIGLDTVRREIVPANTALILEDPVWMLWACEMAQKYNLEFSSALERRIEEILQKAPTDYDLAQAGAVFTRILSAPSRVYLTLQRMADTGVLRWFLPELGDTLDLIPYDSSHDYTVGQHTLYVVKYLEELGNSSGDEETADLHRIFADLGSREVLYLAALLHDAGKIQTDTSHSEAGAALSRTITRRLQWDEKRAGDVAFLVQHHLLMSDTSRLRDLNLESTVRDFVSVVNDVDRLQMLYLLTYADTRAVGAGVWTQVRARFLRDLYRRAERLLISEEPEMSEEDQVRRARRFLQQELPLENLPPDQVSNHIQYMPATYILNTPLKEIALHITYVQRARESRPVIEFTEERGAGYTELTVCTQDDPKPGLLAKISGSLYSADLNIHSAQVYTRHSDLDDMALDVLWVDFRGRPLTPGKRREVSKRLAAVLTGEVLVGDLLASRKAADRTGEVREITVENDLSEGLTLIQALFLREPAALYRLSQACAGSGFNITSARVAASEDRTTVSCYVTGAKDLTPTEVTDALFAYLKR